MKTVYLAGLMRRGVSQCMQWREEATVLLADNFIVRNPFRGKTSARWDTKYTITGVTNKDILLRDYRDVLASDIFLVDVTEYCGEPLIGTFVELGWAWEHRIPVVAFSEHIGSKGNHPFVNTMITSFFISLQEACEHINGYYF